MNMLHTLDVRLRFCIWVTVLQDYKHLHMKHRPLFYFALYDFFLLSPTENKPKNFYPAAYK